MAAGNPITPPAQNKLYLVHCGYYDSRAGEGLYEAHTNFFTVAETFEAARAKARARPEFTRLKMHVDGVQEIESVEGFRLGLVEDPALGGESRSRVMRYGARQPSATAISGESAPSPKAEGG